MGDAAQEWLGDPSSSGRILLTAHLAGPAPTADVLARTLDGLRERHAWRSAGVVEDDGDRDAVLATRHRLVARTHPAPVHVVRTDDALVLSAHHAAVDGLGMLALLGALTGGEVTSDARGVGDRPPDRSALASGLGRSLELLRPPAHLASTRASERREWVRTTVLGGPVGTAALVRASARALEGMPGRRGGRLQVAVGASRRPGRPLGPGEVRDASTWLRLRDPQGLTHREVGDLLRAAAPQPTAGADPGAGRGLVAAAVRRLAGRLGSSMLVSHLGTVEARTVPALRSLEFHPLAGGRSGLALGAATVEGRTTLGLRADAGRTPPSMLDELLDRVVEELVGRT